MSRRPASDPAAPVRDEDAFDVEAVAAWLREHAGPRPDLVGHPRGAAVPRRRLQPDLPAALPRRRDLILRRPPSGHEGQGRARHGPRVPHPGGAGAGLPATSPRMVALCEDESVIGSEFYVMERLDGHHPAPRPPAGVDARPRTQAARCAPTRSTCSSTCTRSTSTRRRSWPRSDQGDGYVARQVDGWSTGFRNARTDDVGDCDDGDGLARRAPARRRRRSCLIHNDFRFDNLVLDRGRPDPVGRRPRLGDGHRRRPADGPRRRRWPTGCRTTTTSSSSQFRRQPTHRAGHAGPRAEVVDYYCERTGSR